MTNVSPCTTDIYQPNPAKIIARRQDASTIFTIQTEFIDPNHKQPPFIPGQFNMLYLYGVGEVAISISSDPSDTSSLSHTIRAVGRATKAMQALEPGDHIGIRGPYGNGWPIEKAIGKDIVIVTGGLGCAPTVSVINYILARREHYGSIKILQGVKHSDDFIFKKLYDTWRNYPGVEVYVAADVGGPQWPFKIGYVTDMIQSLTIHRENTIAMLCGPEMMMHAAITTLMTQGVSETDIYLSMERNMACGIGQCGHCQYGGLFVCKDGPVFSYSAIKDLFYVKGF